jgi:hypothetical protein
MCVIPAVGRVLIGVGGVYICVYVCDNVHFLIVDCCEMMMLCVCVCVCVCHDVRLLIVNACVYVCVYVCDVCMYAYTCVCVCVCMHACRRTQSH